MLVGSMTMFGFLVLGFVAAVIAVAIRNQRHYLDSEPWRAWPLESDGVDLDIPDWVNDARPLEQRFIEAVDVALWEGELWNREGEDA
jgi:hypothetical protein